MHPTADVLQQAGRGGAVAADEGLVVSLGRDHVKRGFLCQLPLHQDGVVVALRLHVDGPQSARTCAGKDAWQKPMKQRDKLGLPSSANFLHARNNSI